MRRSGAFFLLMIPLLFGACGGMPQTKWERLQNIRDHFLEEQVETYLPRRGAKFLDTFEDMRSEYEALSRENQMIRITSAQRTAFEKRLDQAIVFGESLLADTRRQKQDLRRNQAIQIREAANSLWRLKMLPPSSDLEEKVSRSENLLKRATALWEAGEHKQVGILLDQLDLESELGGNVDEIRRRFEDPQMLSRWQHWARDTIEWSRLHEKSALVVDKYQRLAFVYERGNLTEKLSVDLGWNPWRDKLHQGDGATPEGKYVVEEKKGAGETQFYHALLLDYPNESDRLAFESLKRKGELSPDHNPGNLIEIHGKGGIGVDWTDGCVALDNAHMKRLFDASYRGMPVTIVGTLNPQ